MLQSETPWYRPVLLFLAFTLLIVGLAIFLYFVRGVLPPFIIAFAIAWLLDPLLDRIQRMGCSRIIAIAGVYALFLGVFMLGLIYLVPALIDQASQLANDFPSYSHQARSFANQFMQSHHAFLVKFKLPTTLQEVFARYGSQVSGRATDAVTIVTTWIVANVSKALWIILIPLISFYFLTDIDRIRKRFVLLIPEKSRDRTVNVLSKIGTVFSSYVRGLVIVCIMYGILEMVMLTGFRVSYAVILGLLAGILYSVPYIGAAATVLIIFLVSLATYKAGVSYPIWMAPVAAILLNLVFDNGVTPRILGKSVGLHPVLSMFALLAGGQLFGLAGMILAVPVAASIQEIIFQFKPELRNDPKPQTEPEEKKKKRKPKIEKAKS